MGKPYILIADDDKFFCELKKTLLEEEGYKVDYANTSQEILSAIENSCYNLILLDLRIKDTSGIEILRKIREISPETTVIMITSFGSFQTAVEAIKLGAYDYLTKDIDNDELLFKIKHALESHYATQELKNLKKLLGERYSFDNIIGQNPKMQEIYDLIESVADTDVTVLIRGETGTGKELVARAIHFNSSRKDKPFYAINCAAITETLVESELFGHERGAFTGAHKQKIGKVELAHGGTIFLDEIGDMSFKLQAKLLRFLQDKTFERVGGEKNLTADVRVIAATNKNLEEMIKNDEFREDLFYRLNIIQIHLPPLRERLDDIPLLVRHFINKANAKYNKSIERIEDSALDLLTTHNWPGNVRELENTIERAVLLSKEKILTTDILKKCIAKPSELFTTSFVDTSRPLAEIRDEIEKEYIAKLLKQYHGNIQKVAEHAGMTRAAIYQKMEKYNLEKY